jgi:formylglycine-generating enzyme required for sulfatase activity
MLGIEGVKAEILMDWVTVGDSGNSGEIQSQGTFGSVSYDYRISAYEVTNSQYSEFLNNIASADTYNLYEPEMGSSIYGGIERSGSSGSYSYSVKDGWENRPVNYVSWYDCIRFSNWLNNGQNNGDTESGAYAITDWDGINGTVSSRSVDAQIFLPSNDEWYKAAYYKAGGTSAGYWDYATQSNTAPGSVWPTDDTGNSANYDHDSTPPYITDVGAYDLSMSAYGTFDQNGNVYEWLESVFDEYPGEIYPYMRGGAWSSSIGHLASSHLKNDEPVSQSDYIGFRVASPVPEPTTLLLFGLGVGSIILSNKR